MDHAHTQLTLHGDLECGTCHEVLIDRLEHDALNQTDLAHLVRARLADHQRKLGPNLFTADGVTIDFDNDNDLAPDVLIITESFAQITAAIAGYRAQLIGHGFPEEAATEMSVDYHRSFIAHIFAGMTAQS